MLLIIFDRIGLQKNICPQSHNFAIGTSQPVNDIYLRYSAVVATDQWVVQIIIVQSNVRLSMEELFLQIFIPGFG